MPDVEGAQKIRASKTLFLIGPQERADAVQGWPFVLQLAALNVYPPDLQVSILDHSSEKRLQAMITNQNGVINIGCTPPNPGQLIFHLKIKNCAPIPLIKVLVLPADHVTPLLAQHLKNIAQFQKNLSSVLLLPLPRTETDLGLAFATKNVGLAEEIQLLEEKKIKAALVIGPSERGDALVGSPFILQVCTLNMLSSDPHILVSDPAGQRLQYQLESSGNRVFDLSFTPTAPGPHSIVFLLRGKPITGSPVTVHALRSTQVTPQMKEKLAHLAHFQNHVKKSPPFFASSESELEAFFGTKSKQATEILDNLEETKLKKIHVIGGSERCDAVVGHSYSILIASFNVLQADLVIVVKSPKQDLLDFQTTLSRSGLLTLTVTPPIPGRYTIEIGLRKHPQNHEIIHVEAIESSQVSPEVQTHLDHLAEIQDSIKIGFEAPQSVQDFERFFGYTNQELQPIMEKIAEQQWRLGLGQFSILKRLDSGEEEEEKILQCCAHGQEALESTELTAYQLQNLATTLEILSEYAIEHDMVLDVVCDEMAALVKWNTTLESTVMLKKVLDICNKIMALKPRTESKTWTDIQTAVHLSQGCGQEIFSHMVQFISIARNLPGLASLQKIRLDVLDFQKLTEICALLATLKPTLSNISKVNDLIYQENTNWMSNVYSECSRLLLKVGSEHLKGVCQGISHLSQEIFDLQTQLAKFEAKRHKIFKMDVRNQDEIPLLEVKLSYFSQMQELLQNIFSQLQTLISSRDSTAAAALESQLAEYQSRTNQSEEQNRRNFSQALQRVNSSRQQTLSELQRTRSDLYSSYCPPTINEEWEVSPFLGFMNELAQIFKVFSQPCPAANYKYCFACNPAPFAEAINKLDQIRARIAQLTNRILAKRGELQYSVRAEQQNREIEFQVNEKQRNDLRDMIGQKSNELRNLENQLMRIKQEFSMTSDSEMLELLVTIECLPKSVIESCHKASDFQISVTNFLFHTKLATKSIQAGMNQLKSLSTGSTVGEVVEWATTVDPSAAHILLGRSITGLILSTLKLEDLMGFGIPKPIAARIFLKAKRLFTEAEEYQQVGIQNVVQGFQSLSAELSPLHHFVSTIQTVLS